MPRVLVTGGDGFVGHHICRAFLQKDWQVVNLDDGRAGQRMMPINAIRHPRPISFAGLDMVFEKYSVGLVVHAAAKADVSANWGANGESERSDLLENNVQATFHFLEAIEEATESRGIPFVFLSTGAVYGDTERGKGASELIYREATSPYAASKLAGEALVQAYSYRWAKPYWVIRPGCVVGSGYHHGHIADFVRMVKHGNVIHAKNDGWLKKSFVHVLDIADFCVRVGEDSTFLKPGVYNLHGDVWCWRDTVNVMRRANPSRNFTVEAPDDTPHGWIGDPMAVMSPKKYNQKMRTVEEGVLDALISLGWVE